MARTEWYPKAKKIPFRRADGGAYTDNQDFKLILHTTESRNYWPSRDQYYGHWNPPHVTLFKGLFYQHFSFRRAARALQNKAGGVQTNRDCAIQVEIVWNAKDINTMPKRQWKALKQFIEWLRVEYGIQPYCVEFGDSRQYGYRNPRELTNEEWDTFNGVCGHQHVPENAHWDPGPISQKWLDYLGLRVGEGLEGEIKPETTPHELPGREKIEGDNPIAALVLWFARILGAKS